MAHAEATHDPDAPEVYFQFEDIDQQQETYVVGMWLFLMQEIMFFGGLFLMYVVYRSKYQADWYHYHEQLDWRMGAVNTTILLLSSVFAAFAVHFSQRRKTKLELTFLALVIMCAFGFLGVKTLEYGTKFEHHMFPNHSFVYGQKEGESESAVAEQPGPFESGAEKLVGFIPRHRPAEEGNPEKARLFYSLYFAMTGLHGLHVIIGIGCFAALMILIKRKSSLITDYIPTEMLCLYWHFVDLVWIFLYPLFYLIPK